jgi:hypothetical protein
MSNDEFFDHLLKNKNKLILILDMFFIITNIFGDKNLTTAAENILNLSVGDKFSLYFKEIEGYYNDIYSKICKLDSSIKVELYNKHQLYPSIFQDDSNVLEKFLESFIKLYENSGIDTFATFVNNGTKLVNDANNLIKEINKNDKNDKANIGLCINVLHTLSLMAIHYKFT